MNLIAEEAYYWNYAYHLDFSYLDHPPMVAYLIKISTLIFGTNEFAVRLPGLLCFVISTTYIYRLCESIQEKSGIYSILLMAILPFFFVQSIFMTPDLPLIAAWSATLYYLYIALTTDKANAWICAGIAFGMGMISKYTIALLIPATLIYLCDRKKTYEKLLTPYPYIATILALIIFSPVIYWNAKNNWASFLFQSTRRLQDAHDFSLHETTGLFILFLTPLGVISFIQLFKKNNGFIENHNSLKFIRVFSITPLAFFMIFSIFHTTKFNWIGPGLLATIPWIAIQIKNNTHNKILKYWIITGGLLTLVYAGILFCIITGKPQTIHKEIFHKFINWEDFYKKINVISQNASVKFHQPTIIIPLDKYNIASELTFYQAKLLKQKKIQQPIPIYGRNVFNFDALMYEYWFKNPKINNKNIILISDAKYMFKQPAITNNTKTLSNIQTLRALSQNKKNSYIHYYYQTVKI